MLTGGSSSYTSMESIPKFSAFDLLGLRLYAESRHRYTIEIVLEIVTC